MCEDRKSKTEVANVTNILSEETKSALDEIIMFFEPLEIDVDKQLDKEEFNKGLKDASYVCGMYTALLNVGFTQEDSTAYIFQ